MAEEGLGEVLGGLRRDIEELQQAVAAVRAWCAGLEQELERAIRAAGSGRAR
jgi:hypothetical protein